MANRDDWRKTEGFEQNMGSSSRGAVATRSVWGKLLGLILLLVTVGFVVSTLYSSFTRQSQSNSQYAEQLELRLREVGKEGEAAKENAQRLQGRNDDLTAQVKRLTREVGVLKKDVEERRAVIRRICSYFDVRRPTKGSRVVQKIPPECR